jgi:hypothetical protein
MCGDDDGALLPCPTGPGSPGWLKTPTTWRLFGAEGPNGPAPGIPVWFAPTTPQPADGGGPVMRVTGHFDDAGARGCRLFPHGSSGISGDDDPTVQELVCRERFVITEIEPAGAP